MTSSSLGTATIINTERGSVSYMIGSARLSHIVRRDNTDPTEESSQQFEELRVTGTVEKNESSQRD